MRKKIKKQIDKWFMPHWLILFVDFVIISVTFFFTYFLRFNLASQSVDVPVMLLQLICALPFFLLGAYLFKPHRGILRHSTMHDAFSVVNAQLVLSGGLLVVSFTGRIVHIALNIPLSVIIVHYFVSVFTMVVFRFMVQYVYRNLYTPLQEDTNILIYGAGQLGSITRSVILKDNNTRYNIVGYVDDNPSLWKSRIGGIKVYSPRMAIKCLDKLKVKEIILAISPSKIDIERKQRIVDACIDRNLKIKEVPPPSKWINGMLAGNQIKEINIEDLLGRDPISLHVDSISQGIAGKRVMVTGGAGSIGSEIVRQLIYHKPKSIIIVDQAESALFDLQHEIADRLNETESQIYIADITDRYKMQKIFDYCKPQIIYHAAAYKHVPMMELQPYQAVWNNVGGTRNLADLAVNYGVEKFVMVSTDKAVNPTNIMGTTKRICELYIQAFSQQAGMKTQFITTRFGNVLGSNGSVIPLFKKQIAQGGPVTLTHKDIIRYFMTIPEACQLVMEAGFMGHGGEIFLFDMGNPVRIYDLAKKMICLSGFIPHKQIEIIEVGLRPGEKLFEELLADKEETIPTGHNKIKIARIRPYPYHTIQQNIIKLLENLSDMNDMEIVYHMKKIVPEFVSRNSKFEVLDSK